MYFTLREAKGYLVAVKALIQDDKVSINMPEGEVAEKVVYGWEPFTTVNFVNGIGLPASTFMMKMK